MLYKAELLRMLIWSCLAIVDVASSVHEVTKFASVLDAVVWMVEATKRLWMKQRHPQEALFFTKDLNNEETNECHMQDLLKSLKEATF